MTTDTQYLPLLERAFELAAMARGQGDGPYGSLILDVCGRVVAEAGNSVATDGCSTRHAELNAIEQAQARLGRDLSGATLVSSAEPCPMCAGAIYWAGLSRLVYGASIAAIIRHTGRDQIRLDCRTVLGASERTIEVIGPLLEEQALGVLSVD
ncbi:MAG: nucleoside deaminase [Candidatus Competibacterales bacterium]|nr:nucleoside deaminase [Candidatus Competibacterales bacterium]